MFLALCLADVIIMLINVKMPTIVGILTFMSRINFVVSLSWVWKKFFNLMLDARKPVFGVCDHIRLNPDCSATETSLDIKILHAVAPFVVVSSSERTKALIRLRGCAGWSTLLFACNKIRVSGDEVHLVINGPALEIGTCRACVKSFF